MDFKRTEACSTKPRPPKAKRVSLFCERSPLFYRVFAKYDTPLASLRSCCLQLGGVSCMTGWYLFLNHPCGSCLSS